MTKLLRACIRRYTHSIIFWIAVVLTLGVSTQIILDDYFRDWFN